MKAFATLLFAMLASPALAHPGHLADVAGHDHIAAGVAIGVAIALALWGALKGPRDEEASDEVAEDGDAAPAEA